MDPLVLYPAAVGFVTCLTAAIISFNIYLKHRFIELFGLSIGFFAFSIHPLLFVVFSFLEGENYNDWRTIGLKFQLSIGILGLLLIFLFIKNLTGESYRKRQFILIGLFLYGLGFSSNAIQSEWTGGEYVISYNPPQSSILLGIALAWILLELIRLAYKSMKSARPTEKGPFRIIFFAWLIGLLSVISQIVERALEMGSALYLIPMALSFFTIAIALRKDPFAIVPRTIGAQTFIVSENRSGIPAITHEFKQNTNVSDKDVLFSSAMKGILALLEELTGQEDLPKQFGYVNASIIIEQSEHYICYLICFRANNPVRSVMRKILSELETTRSAQNIPLELQYQAVKNSVDKELYFAV